MSMLGKQIEELRWLADHLDETERGMDEYVRAMREAADTIESLRDRLQELQGVGGESRYTALFGTPERAARTLREMSVLHCEGCVVYAPCKTDYEKPCLLNDYDKLLEWLRGDAE